MLSLKIELLDEDSEKSLRSSSLSLLKKLLSQEPENDELRCKIWPSLAGNQIETEHCTLRVLPLNRLGGEEGKSGASVFVAYFFASDKVWPSLPLIVKLAKPKLDSDRDKCKQEFEDAKLLKHLFCLSPTGFAVPLHCDEHNEERPCSVLWSPFASADGIWGEISNNSNRLKLRIEDVWKLLKEADCPAARVEEALKSAFEFLWPLHQKGGRSKVSERSYDQEYGPQLRKIDSADWAAKWRSCWGADDTLRTTDFGQEWANPFNVLKRIRECSANLFCGGVHGDLHPKNIVFSRGTPTIIDFGWANGDAHIAKDFVLFECNVRFVTLPASVSYHDIACLSNWISFDQNAPVFSSDDLRGRLKLVSLIRAKAQKAFPPGTDWDLEYVVPMFMVAIGLLKHSNDFSSQISTRQHVLHLASYISEMVLPRYERKEWNE